MFPPLDIYLGIGGLPGDKLMVMSTVEKQNLTVARIAPTKAARR